MNLDPDVSYEVKIQLYIENLFQTDYTESIIIEDHKKWIDTLIPNDFLFDNALKFRIRDYPWPDA